MISIEDIVARYRDRESKRARIIGRMALVRAHYNDEVVVPLPDMDRTERPAVANLLTQGVDQTARRIASTTPLLYCPPRDPDKKSEQKAAEVRRKALLGWWEMNDLTDVKVMRRARHFVAYGSAPVSMSWDFKRSIPRWKVRDPLNTFPAPVQDPDCNTPDDTIFAFARTRAWLTEHYPEAHTEMFGMRANRPDDAVTVLEYNDYDETVLVCVGDAPAGRPSVGGRAAVLLERIPNRAQICLSVVPGRVTLDHIQGQFDGMLGMYQMSARLMALEVIAAEKGVFPDLVLIGQNGSEPRLLDGEWYDGRTGRINRIVDGDFKEASTAPGYQTNPTIDRLERAQRLTGGIPAEYGGECVDEETEILTAAGWKRYDAVSVGDEVLTLNHETGLSEWQPVLAMNVHPALPGRPMMEMDGPRFSALTTLNHRWPVISRWNGERQWKFSTEITSNHRVPLAALNADLPVEAKYSDALVEIVAWFYTEGSVHESGAQVSQSTKNPENVERIRAALTALFGPATQRWRDLSGCGQGGVGHDGVPRWDEQKIAKNGVIKWRLSAHAARLLRGHAPDKVPSHDFLRALTAAQLELFLNVSMLADNCGPARFGQKDIRRTEAFAFACVLAGRAVSFQTRHRDDARPEWPDETTAHIVRMKDRRFANPKENAQRGVATFREVTHAGIVWCPTTPNGSWYARRKGTAYFTGNSPTNVRTGKRGDAVLSATIDFTIQEAQRLLARSYQDENRRAIALAKAYAGSRPTSYYVNWKGAQGVVTYTPNEVFTTDENIVKYSYAGSDLSQLIIVVGQAMGTGLMSQETARELLPIIDDPALEQARLTREKIEEAVLGSLLQKAQTDGIAPADIAWLEQQVSKGASVGEALIALDKRVSERQATPAAPGTPEAMAGLASGTPAEQQAAQPTIGPSQGTQGLADLLQTLRSPQRTLPVERGAVA